MSEYSLLINILNRELEDVYLEYYKASGVNAMFSCLCCGTASKSVLDYLGLEKNEKIMGGLVSKMGINLPGTGIALTIPVGSIAGSASLKYLTEGQSAGAHQADEVKKMSDYMYTLITVIAEKGCSDMVMDAARKAGDNGGTVVHAKGTATEFTAKFFGVSIASEKEMIYIVARKNDKDKIMKAILEDAGPATDARAAVFSLPVEDVVGLRSVMEQE